MPPGLYEFVNQESNVLCLSTCGPHTPTYTSYYHSTSVLILLYIFIGQLQVGRRRECGVGVSAFLQLILCLY